MTQDEIIEMARQAELDWHTGWVLNVEQPNRFEIFAKLVAAKEREEIAEFIDSTEMKNLPDVIKNHYARLLSFYSSQIRARGEA